MTLVRRFFTFIRSLSPRQWMLGLIGLVVALVFFLGVSYAWEYSNSSPFCGTTCHTMPPAYESYQRSPHARVQCTECHIGRTSFGIQITRKAVDVQFVVAYLFNQYEYPLHAKGLQPAAESCEKCHWPEKFSWDKVVTLSDFLSDQKNTQVDTTLVLRTGGGTARTGLGRGIHWHIENKIEFKYSDKLLQEIPWIQVTNADGTKTIYTDLENPMTPDQLTKLPTRQMDCIDCHNRVSHNFQSPEHAIDTALQNKVIDTAIPEIKKKGVEVLTPSYKTSAEAKQAIGNLEQFYRQTYSAFYNQNTAKVQKAIQTLQTLYPQIHYPDQELDWKTHPDNIGHKDWPGCFRCHDGKHFTTDKKEAIRLECNVCHAIPEVTTPGGPVAVFALARPDEPESHKKTTWLAEHRLQFNTSCQVCHDTNNAGGKDNSSFCSNSACHGTTWNFAGLNAPQLADIVKAPIRPVSAPNSPPKAVPHPVGGNPDCLICHGSTAKVFPYPADHNNRAISTCLTCHKPTVPTTPAATPVPGTTAGGPPKITHNTAGRTQCLGCHGTGAAGIPQITQFHKDFGFANNNCMTCHKPGTPGETAATPAPAPTPIPTVRPTTAPASSSSSASSASSASTRSASSSASSASAATKSSSSVSSSASAGGPPKLPASHAGRTAGCIACHSTGVGGAPKSPAATHTAFTADDSCGMCHKP